MFGSAASGSPASRIPRSARRATVGPAPWFVPIAATSSSGQPARGRRRRRSRPSPPPRRRRSGARRSAATRPPLTASTATTSSSRSKNVSIMKRSTPRPSSTLRLLGVERPVLGRVEDLELPERADRARDEDVPSRDLARLAREAHAGGVDLLERVVEQQPRQLAPVRAEGVRLDQLGARGDVPRVHRRRRSRVRGGSPPPGTAGRRRHRRAALPSRRPRRSGDRSGGARGTGSRLATVPAWSKQGRRQAPLQTNEWLPRKWEPAPPRAKRVRWPVRTIGATRPSIHHPHGSFATRDA